MIKLKCEICNRSFEVKPYREKTAQYCSRKCRSVGVYRAIKENGYGLSKVDGSHLIGNTHRKGMKPVNAFLSGNVPWNKGMKGLRISPETEFTKGIVPRNKVSVGTITQRIDKNGTWRNHIKVEEPNEWKPYAVYLWEGVYGRTKKGSVIHHINKNALDDRLENLQMISRKEHLEIHREDYKEIGNSRLISKAAVFI